MKEVKLTPEQKREFEEHHNWCTRIASGCENLRAPKFLSIPTGLPTCAETNKPCRFDICPKRKSKEYMAKLGEEKQ